jgi:hypothetical protein
LTANPRVSRAVSAEPRDPGTGENRANTGVFAPSARNAALLSFAAVP